MSDAMEREQLLEPKKYDPSRAGEQKMEKEDAISRYRSVAGKNPYAGNPSFRDGLKERECHLPWSPTKHSSSNGSFNHQQIWILPSPPTLLHPSLRGQQQTEISSIHDTPVKQLRYEQREYETSSKSMHNRTVSQALSPSLAETAPHSPNKRRNGISKSFSDTNIFPSRSGSAQKGRRSTPKPLILSSSPHGKDRLAAIQEPEDYAINYKVQVRESLENEERVIRSPLKRLFGEGGLLGRNPSTVDAPDPKYKKSGLAFWGGKVKQRVEDVGKDVSGKFSFTESAFHTSSSRLKISTFPVTLSPYVQGDFYMQLELLLNLETNKFLMQEYQNNRVSVSSVKSIVENWTKKGRPQVLGFRYDITTQRDLIQLNADTLHFAGIHAFNRVKVLSVLASWKVLAKEIALRTFCQPDSAVKKHLHDAEKVLELIDASPDSMLAFQEVRTRVITEIYSEEKAEHERKFLNGVERPVRFGTLE